MSAGTNRRSLYDFGPQEMKALNLAELGEPESVEETFATEQAERRSRYPKFAALVEVEPALALVEALVCDLRRSHDAKMRHKPGFVFCANYTWYGHDGLYDSASNPVFVPRPSIKRMLEGLVGWRAHKRELRNEKAYDTAYEHLYALLPNCHGCNCPPG